MNALYLLRSICHQHGRNLILHMVVRLRGLIKPLAPFGSLGDDWRSPCGGLKTTLPGGHQEPRTVHRCCPVGRLQGLHKARLPDNRLELLGYVNNGVPLLPSALDEIPHSARLPDEVRHTSTPHAGGLESMKWLVLGGLLVP